MKNNAALKVEHKKMNYKNHHIYKHKLDSPETGHTHLKDKNNLIRVWFLTDV